MTFRWETPLYHRAGSAAVCDIPGKGRILIKRKWKGAKEWTAVMNGTDMKWGCKSMDAAKRAAMDYVERHGVPTPNNGGSA